MPFPKKTATKSKAKKSYDDEEYDNTLRGVLFENEDKTKKSQPDYRGSYTNENGEEFWVAAWLQTSKKGLEFISMAMTAKEEQAEEEAEEEVEEEIAPKRTSKRKK